MGRSTSKISELARQLNLLPYFQKHEGRSIMEAARDLGYTPAEIMEDLNRLWMCGLPGLLPGDLVELEHSYAQVKIFNAQGMDKPLRLTPTEAGVLLLTLESLESLPGLTNQEAVVSAASKLRAIMGDSATVVFDSTVEDLDGALLSVIRISMDERKQVEITYHSHSSDNTSTRRISPAHIFINEGETYIKAWDHERSAHRTFRMDRIKDISLIDVPSNPHAGRLRFSSDNPFDVAKDLEVAEFLLREDAVWLADYMPLDVQTHACGKADKDGFMWVKASHPVLSKEWFIRFAISNAEHLRIVSPEDLRLAVIDKVQLGLSAYNHQLT